MSAAAAVAGIDVSGPAKKSGGKGGKKKLILLAVPVLLIALGAGLWFTGILPNLLGMKHEAAEHAEGAEHGGHGGEHAAAKKEPAAPVFVELPEMIANLNAGRRNAFIKLKARLELSKPEDQAAIAAAQPRLVDLFQTYLREMRPEELRGSAGIYRLREELIARASLVAAPAKVVDVLFTELLVQ